MEMIEKSDKKSLQILSRQKKFHSPENMSIVEIINDRRFQGELMEEEKERKEAKQQKRNKKQQSKEQKNDQEKEQKKQETKETEKAQIKIINGKAVLVLPGTGSREPINMNKEVIEINHGNQKLTSYNFLRPSKRQRHDRWNPLDSQKFYDALIVFGENLDMIHQLVFSKQNARCFYQTPENDFSERSYVQLNNKFKKEWNQICKILEQKDPQVHTISWFEQKWRLQIAGFQKDDEKIKNEFQLDDASSDEDFKREGDSDQSIPYKRIKKSDMQGQDSPISSLSAGPASAGLISAFGLPQQ